MSEPSWPLVLWQLKSQIQEGCFALLFLYALAGRAAAPERILAGLLCAMIGADRIYHAISPTPILWGHTDLVHVGIDTAMLACTGVVAIYANRVYPLWIGAAQIIALSGHAYRLTLSRINEFAYDMMVMLPSYIQLLAMALGLAFHMSRRRKLGSYPSWRRSSSPTRVVTERRSPAG